MVDPTPDKRMGPRLGVLGDLFRVKAIFQLRTVENILRQSPDATEARRAPEPPAKGSHPHETPRLPHDRE